MRSTPVRYPSVVAVIFAALSVSVCLAEDGATEQKAADDSYSSVVSDYQKGRYASAYERAEEFIAKHPGHKELGNVLFYAGSSAAKLQRLEPAVRHLRRIVEEYPDHRQTETVRDGLAWCYSGLRQLDACIAQAKSNLELAPTSRFAGHWTFLIAHSHFRLHRFDQSKPLLEAFVEKYPDSKYLKHAKKALGLIDPTWKIGENGIVDYSGKFIYDVRLRAAMAALPKQVDDGFRMLEERLGVDLKPHTDVVYIFVDTPAAKREMVAEQLTAGRNNKPIAVVRFYVEQVVTRPRIYQKTVVHELKHAGFKGIMGQSYDELPHWIREGLASWGADQLDDRIQGDLCAVIVSSKDPMSVLDGIEDPVHDLRDYLEDVLAFEWLESIKAGNVKQFCRRLVKGEPYREIWADLAGMSYDEAIAAANAHCRARVEAALAAGYKTFAAHRDANYAAMRQGNAGTRRWADGGGLNDYQKWLSENPGHPAEPFARFCLARAYVTVGQYEYGRKLLRQIIKEDSHRCSLMDDAQYWLGVSYHQQRDAAKAKAAFNVLLRDFPHSKFAASVKPAASR